jgi:ribosomal-protein-serine acetyltransferase
MDRGYGVSVERAVDVLPERIEAEAILLRRWRVDDAEALGRAVGESADHLRPWMAFMSEEPQTVEQRRAMLRERQRRWSEGGDVMLGVFVRDEVAGGCGLHRRHAPDELEIGYWIHPSFTGRGLATAVARLLIDAAFSLPGITGVEIHHDKANTASAGVPRRLGFHFVGETADEAKAPAAVGIDCTWRLDRDDWQRDRHAT